MTYLNQIHLPICFLNQFHKHLQYLQFQHHDRNFFTKDEFKEKIKSRYLNDSKAEVIANSYFDVVDSNYECIKRRENNDIIKYQVSNGKLRELGMQILRKSSLLRQFNNNDNTELEKFYAEIFFYKVPSSIFVILSKISKEII